jgi:uncharacterized protein YcfJ
MNRLTTGIATALCGLSISVPAFADRDDWRDHDHGYEYAQVVRSEPIYREVRIREPREECRQEPVTERTHYAGGGDPGAMLFGAIVGGVIGHQFGGGHGRDVATAAGAVIGANQAASATYQNGRTVERTTYEEQCRDTSRVRYEQEVVGYDVTYRYHGRMYHTRRAHDPGSRIRVWVDVRPDQEDLD